MIVFPHERFPSAGDVFPAFFLFGRAMREPSIFVDESGSDGLSDLYYLFTVVMRDQSDSIADSTEVIRERPLRERTPGHTFPCVAAHERSVPVSI